jgi:hypothetical protein
VESRCLSFDSYRKAIASEIGGDATTENSPELQHSTNLLIYNYLSHCFIIYLDVCTDFNVVSVAVS